MDEAPLKTAAGGDHEDVTGAEGIVGAAPGKVLSPEARRALAEAAARRAAAEAEQAAAEIGGPAGPEPTRYGDWERNGVASDF